MTICDDLLGRGREDDDIGLVLLDGEAVALVDGEVRGGGEHVVVADDGLHALHKRRVFRGGIGVTAATAGVGVVVVIFRKHVRGWRVVINDDYTETAGRLPVVNAISILVFVATFASDDFCSKRLDHLLALHDSYGLPHPPKDALLVMFVSGRSHEVDTEGYEKSISPYTPMSASPATERRSR